MLNNQQLTPTREEKVGAEYYSAPKGKPKVRSKR
jgi:hypothetical protein